MISVTLNTIQRFVPYTNVLRKLLPDASGHFIKFNTDIDEGMPIPADGNVGGSADIQIDWEMTNIKEADNLAAIVFVQDNNTKEIYQAEIYRASGADALVDSKN